ncbi:DUF975 family protein [Candidatus Izemoplasma sp. B36]|uniref:DUF975 family protein n=1 Tax=Candidatus Izemoplasma sp. B36 TaxID=3242468 RepID=UPI0035586547
MKTSKDYRIDAENLLRGKYTEIIVTFLAFSVVSGLLGFIYSEFAPKYDYATMVVIDNGQPFLAFIVNVLNFMFTVGFMYAIFYITIRIIDNKVIDIKEAFMSGFKNNYSRNLGLHILMALYTFLWALLFIIPGIVKSYAYSMSFYLVNKEPELKSSDAIDKSRELMNGYKMNLFILDLSYIGWYLLSILTFGILLLWVVPRHYTARTLMYDYIYNRRHPKENVQVKEEPELI